MEQRTDRCRGNHGAWQPVMERHDTILGKSKNAADIQYGYQGGVNVWRQNTSAYVRCKIKVAGQNIDKDHGRQYKSLCSCGQVNNILPGPGIPFFILVMSDQWVGADTDDLIKEIQGKKVVRKSHTNSPEE